MSEPSCAGKVVYTVHLSTKWLHIPTKRMNQGNHYVLADRDGDYHLNKRMDVKLRC